MPTTYGFYIKLLGLSEMEMLDVLHNIHDEQLDTAAGGTLIQDYKERRCLLLQLVVLRYVRLCLASVLLHHFNLKPKLGYKGRTQEVPLHVTHP